MNESLIPPGDNTIATSFTRLILPAVLQHHQLEVTASQECIDAVQRLRGESTVILLNHADRFDPLCVFALSRMCNEDFNYLASREQFDGALGLKGWCLQQLGAYSVIRGEPEDYASKELTVSLITEGKRKLVMFPEGDVTGRDDAILPLKEDGIRNILAAQQRILANGSRRQVFLLPISIYYRSCSDAIPRLNECLDCIENHLQLPVASKDFEPRIRRIVNAMALQLASHYGVELTGFSLDQRLLEIIWHVSNSIAAFYGIEHAPEAEPMVVLHTVRGQLWRLLHSATTVGTKYDARLADDSRRTGHAFMVDLDRLEQLLILAHTLQQYEFSLEEAWRIIDRLEQEILGRTTKKGHRIASMEAAPPISMLQFRRAHLYKNRAVRLVDQKARIAMYSALLQSKKSSYSMQDAA